MESEPVHGRELGQHWQPIPILDWIGSSSSRNAHNEDDADVSCECLFKNCSVVPLVVWTLLSCKESLRGGETAHNFD